VAVVGRVKSGYDAEYMWAQIGDAATRRDPAGYYINAGGEPPGRWWGKGAEALGFTEGQEIERAPYNLVFAERLDPRDGATRLGKRPGAATAEALYGRLLDAEPHATAERKAQLHAEAEARSRTSPLYQDATFSLSKSISLFHASLGERAREARQERDAEGDTTWTGILGELDEAIHAANRAALSYLQEHAGYTRTGAAAHASQYHEADFAVASWLQHASRDDDPQMHVHNQILQVVRTRLDGKWRAGDTFAYAGYMPAAASIFALHLETWMTERFGVGWEQRDDGTGCEIGGIGQELMDEFSSRRDSVTEKLAELAQEWEDTNGRPPTQAVLSKLTRAAVLATRKRKDHEPLDLDALRARWDQKLREEHGVRLADIALCSLTHPAPADGATALTRDEEAQVARAALARLQAWKPAWTQAMLVHAIGNTLPAKTRAMGQEYVMALVLRLADEALAGAFQPVRCLEAPAAVRVPDHMIRADGRSVYQRHGSALYATNTQLSMEEELAGRALAKAAPVMPRRNAASLLGATEAELDAFLAQPAHADALRAKLSCGATAAQGAAIFRALTSGQLITAISAPAGAGKTYVAGQLARMAREAGVPVFGTAPSQTAVNVLRAATKADSWSHAQLLGHDYEGQLIKRPKMLPRGSVLIVDEASLSSMANLADITRRAAREGWRIVMIGDPEQLQAVQGGGGFRLIVDHGGAVNLPNVIRFAEPWEGAASLRLRAGDQSVLAEYDEHGRFTGASRENAMEQARRSFVADRLAGKDPTLLAQSHDVCREVNRRIQDDLIHLGQVSGQRTVRLRYGMTAGAGDDVIARKNNHACVVGPGGRTLTNGDVLKITRVEGQEVTACLVLDCGQDGTQLLGPEFTFTGARKADLAYCVTGHSAQGRTVSTSTALVTGTEDRHWLYVALSRGRLGNFAIVTEEAQAADPRPSTRPAPELDRHRMVGQERAGLDADPVEPLVPKGTPVRPYEAALADVMARAEGAESATEVARNELISISSLRLLDGQFRDQVLPLKFAQYEKLLRDALPADHQQAELSGRATWLWRTLRTAEAAGYDAGEVIQRAVASRSLGDARDIAAVVNARIQDAIGSPAPRPAATWAEQVPGNAEGETRRFLEEVAQAADDRQVRIGENLALWPQAWTVKAFGPVPADPVARLDWERRAAAVGAYRETYQYADRTDPIGIEPTADSPEKRAAWHAALAALGPADGPDLRSVPDGALLGMRSTYERLTAQAPEYRREDLRDARVAAAEAERRAVRADAEERIATRRGREQEAAGHQVRAREARKQIDFHREREAEFEKTAAVHKEWAASTDAELTMAVKADAEYRQRHPDEELAPLRSAEPEPDRSAPATWPHKDPGLIKMAERNNAAQAKLDERQNVRVPHEDHEHEDLGEAWPKQIEQELDPLLQPPKPEIQALARQAERQQAEADFEAGS